MSAIQSAAPGARAASTVRKPPVRTAAADIAPRCAHKNASAFHATLRDPVIGLELLVLINDKAAKGRLRSWAAFTHTAGGMCRSSGAERIDKMIARNAIAQLGGVR